MGQLDHLLLQLTLFILFVEYVFIVISADLQTLTDVCDPHAPRYFTLSTRQRFPDTLAEPSVIHFFLVVTTA